MITIQSLAETILLPTGLHTDMLQVEAMKQKVLAFRQTLIQQDFSRSQRFNEQVVQAFDIQLREVSEGNDRFFVSDELPKPMMFTSRKLPFISVSTALKGRIKRPLSFLFVEEVPYIDYRKFTKKSNFYTYENNRIVSYAPTKNLRVRAVWDDPIAAYKFAEKETYQLACSKETIKSECSDGIDILLEETLAARILTFFNNSPTRRNANTNQDDTSSSSD